MYEEDISAIQVPVGEYLRLIFEHLGEARFREHLMREDWKQVIGSDSKLKTVRVMR